MKSLEQLFTPKTSAPLPGGVAGLPKLKIQLAFSTFLFELFLLRRCPADTAALKNATHLIQRGNLLNAGCRGVIFKGLNMTNIQIQLIEQPTHT